VVAVDKAENVVADPVSQNYDFVVSPPVTESSMDLWIVLATFFTLFAVTVTGVFVSKGRKSLE